MNFTEYLRERILRERLKEHRILVVYDPEGRYESICDALADENCKVIRSAGRPVTSRMEVLDEWKKLCADSTLRSQLVLYTRDAPPTTDDEKRSHPFTAFVTAGSQFPDGPKDDYQQLCFRFLPDRRTEITQLFSATDTPSLAHIDSLAGGVHAHPRLESIFGTGEVSKILLRFLAPDPRVKESLDGSTDWCEEFRQLTDRTLGFRFDPRATQADTIRPKLWQFLLFSEFAIDLPGTMPEALVALPRAEGTSIPVVLDLCQELRKNHQTKEAYREAANEIQSQLDLPQECEGLANLGNRDTFSFEEARFLAKAITAIRGRLPDQAKKILDVHHHSLWTEEGERQLLWRILELCLDTLGAIKQSNEQLKLLGAGGSALCSLYEKEVCKVDRFQRELENAVAQTDQGFDEVEDAVQLVRGDYRQYLNQLQERFLGAVQQEGWPLDGIPANQSTFDRVVTPLLKAGTKVAYFMVDALRLELAQKLSESMAQDFPNQLTATCAQLPCVTRFGMAALLPDCEENLRFEMIQGELQPVYAGDVISSREKRLEIFSRNLRDRVTNLRLDQLLKESKTTAQVAKLKTALKDKDLLVITSTELDESGESSLSLRQHLPNVLDQILRAIRRCAELGFQKAVIATDHGFIWLDELDSGSICTKPTGDWSLKKRRCFIGRGDEAPGSIRFSTSALSIPTDEPSMVVPRTLGAYERGNEYFHEGLSLQESLVSCLVADLTALHRTERAMKAPELILDRKRNKVSSLIVAVNLSWPGEKSLLGEVLEFDLFAIQDKQVIGSPISSDVVDPVTGWVRLSPGESIKVSLRLTDEAKEGPFKVKVRDLKTEKDLASLDLTYDPHVF